MTVTPAAPPTPDAEEPVRFQVREPGDFVALVPYLLRFHPENSIVVLLLRAAQLVLTARMDLPPPGGRRAVEAHVAYLLDRTEADEFVLVGYGDRAEDRATVTSLVRTLRSPLGEALREALWVEPERWWSLTCRRGCCPPEGQPYDPRAHPLAAAAVWAGLDAGGGRADLAALAAGPASADQEALRRRCAVVQRRVGGGLGSRMRRLDRLVQRLSAQNAPPGIDDALSVAWLCTDVRVRDVAVAALDRVTAPRQLDLWSAIVRRVPDELAPAPLCLLGIAGWLTGNGALLNCCLERIDAIDPEYALAQLCRQIADGVVPPAAWDSIVAELRSDPDLRLE